MSLGEHRLGEAAGEVLAQLPYDVAHLRQGARRRCSSFILFFTL